MALQPTLLSASAAGKAILVTGNSLATADLLHEAVAGDRAVDEVYISVANNHTGPVQVTLMWGDDDPEDLLQTTIAPNIGRVRLVDGDVINNGQEIRMYASVPNVISVTGQVNRYPDPDA